jgi:hypothetical protein
VVIALLSGLGLAFTTERAMRVSRRLGGSKRHWVNEMQSQSKIPWGLTTRFAGGAGAAGVAIQADSKIVAAGGAGKDERRFALARYQPSGALDATFGGDGKVTTRFAGDAFAEGGWPSSPTARSWRREPSLPPTRPSSLCHGT